MPDPVDLPAALEAAKRVVELDAQTGTWTAAENAVRYNEFRTAAPLVARALLDTAAKLEAAEARVPEAPAI